MHHLLSNCRSSDSQAIGFGSQIRHGTVHLSYFKRTHTKDGRNQRAKPYSKGLGGQTHGFEADRTDRREKYQGE